MKTMKNTSAVALSFAAATLLASTASAEETTSNTKIAADTNVQCHGVNACQGQSECATANSACKGQNACQGQGWVTKTKADCDTAGGKVVVPTAKKDTTDAKGKSEDKNMTEAVASDEKGQCHGVNACKGHSACATATTSCAGHNACKGQGWVVKSKSDCDAAGGKFVAKK